MYSGPINTGPGPRADLLKLQDWRDDLSYPLLWEPRWSGWRIPTPLWFWDDDSSQARTETKP